MAPTQEKANCATPQVLEYLNKKGYSKSEAMLRMESNTEGGPLQTTADEPIGIKYMRVFGMSNHLGLRPRSYINVLLLTRPDVGKYRRSIRYLQSMPLSPSQMQLLMIDRRI